MLRSRYLILIIYLFLFSTISAQEKTEPYIGFLNLFENNYNIASKKTDIKLISKRSSRIEQTGLIDLKTYRFKAKDQIKGKKGFYLQFRLSVYKYKNQSQAIHAFKKFNIKEKKIEDYLRNKSPMIALLKDRNVYILDGSCLYSRINMDSLEGILIKILYKKKPGKNLYLKKICGGSFE